MKLGVFIGRFQPFHRGHLHVVQSALREVDRLLILIGSADEPRTDANPWTADERADMILHGLPGDIPDAVETLPIFDHGDDRAWADGVRRAVYGHASLLTSDLVEISLVGFAKDHTSFYLKLFPEWRSIAVSGYGTLSATPMRWDFFDKGLPLPLADVGEAVQAWTEDWVADKAGDYGRVAAEFRAAREFREPWGRSPYPPTFITTDALVTSGDEVALIRRDRAPGLGLLALPGGFLEPNLTLLQNAIKELGEETGGGIKRQELPHWLADVRVFDKPGRDPRGRFVTHVHHFALPSVCKPRLIAGDDAEWAGWVPRAEIERSQMFADHFQIIQLMLPRQDR